MKADEAADLIDQDRTTDRFKQRAAIAIGILAMLLAITSLGGQNATKEALNANIQASNLFKSQPWGDRCKRRWSSAETPFLAGGRNVSPAQLLNAGIEAYTHCLPLHSAPAGRRYGRVAGQMTVTEQRPRRCCGFRYTAA
jgi:hypothetical protein